MRLGRVLVAAWESRCGRGGGVCEWGVTLLGPGFLKSLLALLVICTALNSSTRWPRRPCSGFTPAQPTTQPTRTLPELQHCNPPTWRDVLASISMLCNWYAYYATGMPGQP